MSLYKELKDSLIQIVKNDGYLYSKSGSSRTETSSEFFYFLD